MSTKIIKLTDGYGRARRFPGGFSPGTNYYERDQGTYIEAPEGGVWVHETPDEIDRLLADDEPATPQPAQPADPLVGELVEARRVLENFRFTGPDDDGVVWLEMAGNGTTGSGMARIGHKSTIVAQVAQHLEEDRRAALSKARATAQPDPTEGDLFFPILDDEEPSGVGSIADLDTNGPGTVTVVRRFRRLPDAYAGTNHNDETRVFTDADAAEAFAATGEE